PLFGAQRPGQAAAPARSAGRMPAARGARGAASRPLQLDPSRANLADRSQQSAQACQEAGPEAVRINVTTDTFPKLFSVAGLEETSYTPWRRPQCSGSAIKDESWHCKNGILSRR